MRAAFSPDERARPHAPRLTYTPAETVPATTSLLTLDPSPSAGDAVRITQAGVPAAGDVLVEARSFNDVWDGPAALNDGDFDDNPFLVREGIVVHQIGPVVFTPTEAHSRYSSMDNTGFLDRRSMHFDTIYNALVSGQEPPHVGYALGDAFTPLSRFRFNFRGGPLDSRVALTDIVVGPSSVSVTLWDNFLTVVADRTVRTNYTLANHAAGSGFGADYNRARTDDFTFGGTLRLGGTHGRIMGGTPTITLAAIEPPGCHRRRQRNAVGTEHLHTARDGGRWCPHRG